MPLYEYECKKCGHRFEKIQLYSAKMVKKCPECGGQVEQMISAPAVQFKGFGLVRDRLREEVLFARILGQRGFRLERQEGR